MKIIITEKVNRELLEWQAGQKEKVHVVSWTAEVNYKPQHNESNLYQFMRKGYSEYLIKDLPWIKQQVLNYRSIPGNHELEFKDAQNNVVIKVYLRKHTQFVEHVEVMDCFGNTLSNLIYSGKNLAQQIDYDTSGHPVQNCLFGQHQKITTFWHAHDKKINNIGMSLVTKSKEVFYSRYWDWHFEAFRQIIGTFENVSEIISYEAPTLNIDIPNKRVLFGELMSKTKRTKTKKWIVNFQKQNFWKPRNDVSKAAMAMGYTPIDFDTPYIDNEKWMTAQLEKHCLQINSGDTVVWQYPKYSPQLELNMLNWFHNRGIKVASFIHDINLLREEPLNREHYLPEYDKILLSSFDANIVPEKFEQALYSLANVKLKNIVALKPYDFIIQKPVLPATYSQDIVYAGSLAKFPALEDIDFNLTVYGEKNFSDVNFVNPKIIDGGFLPAEELASSLNNGFGLIWDEDRQNPYRQAYTKWNWPYKFSLYMVSGLPVIAWSESAIAKLIESENLGFIVTDLSQIASKVRSISQTEFNEMAANAAEIGNKLAHGNSTKTALKKLENCQCP
ncbi:glycosyl transferase [Leuconostoc citreum]|uniref:glycosyl transferase n=1 Tax=Leuconostoc citreum TaxID=33964 RepID=UPI001910C00C|nr:glycosyl transferase [Leuconostoc citreum]QQE97907.1 glycosyl transferase [Leuconostoc citreum]